MTEGECCRGPEPNRIPFALKEFLKTKCFFPDPFEVVSRATLVSFPYLAIYTSASLNVTCPFWTMLVIMPRHCLSNNTLQRRDRKSNTSIHAFEQSFNTTIVLAQESTQVHPFALIPRSFSGMMFCRTGTEKAR